MYNGSMIAALILTGALGVVATTTPGSAATVTELTLPAGFTVLPEGERRLVSIAPNHTVAALAQVNDMTWRSRAFRWSSNRTRTIFSPLPVDTAPDHGTAEGTPKGVGGVVAGPTVAYVAATESFSGAYSGISYEVQRWTTRGTRRWSVPSCASGFDESDQHVNAVDARGRVALTLDITGSGSFLALSGKRGAHAPRAFIIDGEKCVVLGRAVVLGLRDRWAAGYQGYLDGHVAPTNFNTVVQTIVAVRWHGNTLTELGDGAAYAVNADGFAVGASTVAGGFETMTTPHAVAWDAHGRKLSIERGARRSVAYDVGDDGTVVGMLQATDGKHYAFRWRAGRLDRLDDLPHPRGWRFESAYAIAPDGTVAGIGTHDGIAAVFTWRN